MAPTTAAQVSQEASLALSGTATDFEDGELSGESLAWELDKDGFLGTGRLVYRQALSTGNHILTLAAVDSDGNTGSYAIPVSVLPTYKSYFPVLAKGYAGGW